MAEITDELELVPNVVRTKLDRVGIKLHLREWQLLSLGDRRQLCDLPCESDDEVRHYAALLNAWVETATGHRPQALPPKA